MAIIDMQKQLGVTADGLWGDGSHKAFLAQGRKLDFNWDYLRQKLRSSFTQDQVNGLNHIMDACNRAQLKPQHAAYILATTWHETAFKMQPISEYGRGKSRMYGKWYKNSKGEEYGWRVGGKKRKTYLKSEYPHLYYGRGYPQLTWLDNYLRASRELGVDFANNPELANDPKHSADIITRGSMQGWFTTIGIPDCIKWGHFDEMKEARRVINGTDQRSTIATYAKIFLTAMDLKAI